MTFSETLRELRWHRRLTTRKLAAMAGSSSAMISNYERGAEPSLGVAMRLAIVLDFSLDEIASHIEPPGQTDES